MRELRKDECDKYFFNYAKLVPKGNLLDLLKSTHKETQKFFNEVGEINGNFRYAPGKWSLKEVLIHMIDVEHIMGCRALKIARNEKTPLPSFNENEYNNNANVSSRTISDLMEEYDIMRNLTIVMFKHFDNEMLDRIGTVSGKNMSALATAYIIIGHEIHHCKVIKERYLG